MSETTDKLFDILSNDQRIIVASDRELGLIVTWNRSQTLQLWDSNLDEVNTRAILCEIEFDDARMFGVDWLNDIRCEVNDPTY
jgi:hypothetical protein